MFRIYLIPVICVKMRWLKACHIGRLSEMFVKINNGAMLCTIMPYLDWLGNLRR